MGVLEVGNVALVGQHGWVVAEDSYLLSDQSWYGFELGSAYASLPSRSQSRNLAGVCLSLATEWADENYGHFVHDCLPRYHLFQAAGYSIDAIDWVYLPQPPSGVASELLRALRIPERKYVWALKDQNINVQTLLVPSFPGVRRNVPPWVPEFLRSLIDLPLSTKKQRLYVDRRGYSRNLDNEHRIAELLKAFHFENFCVSDSLAEFTGAECVIGPHGSALTNIAFCGRGASVLELIPTDHVSPQYYTLAESATLRYSCLAGESRHRRPMGSWGPSPYDFRINEQDLVNAIECVTQFV